MPVPTPPGGTWSIPAASDVLGGVQSKVAFDVVSCVTRSEPFRDRGPHAIMNILVTSSRMPFALDEIRKLGRSGHRVFATDALESAPGSHSRYTTEAFVTVSPRTDAQRFIAQLRDIIDTRSIDLVLPCYEEVFWIARHVDELEGVAVLASTPMLLERLHDKSRFVELARELSIRVPATELARSATELEAAIDRCPSFIAQPAFSRGGVELLTNVGPLAGRLRLSECRPTEENPWIVREFVHGTDLCTFSVARHGDLRAHVAYVHPRTIEHTGGITFESVEDEEALAAVKTIVSRTGYHGQLSFDFIRSERGLYCLECNPRPTLGVALMGGDMFVDAVLGEVPAATCIVPAGAKRKITWGLVRNVFRNPRDVALDLRALVRGGKDIHMDPRDPLPAFYQMVAALTALRRERDVVSFLPKGSRTVAAYLHDSAWDGPALDPA